MMGVKRRLFPEEEEPSLSIQTIRKPAWGDSLAGCADELTFANPAAAHRRGKRQRDPKPSKVVSVLMTLDPTHSHTNENTRRIRQPTITERRTVPVDSLGSLGLAVASSSSSVLDNISLSGPTSSSSSSSSRRNNKSNSKINFRSKQKAQKKKSPKSASKSSQGAKTKAKKRRSKRTRDHVDTVSISSGLGAFCNLKMNISKVKHNLKPAPLCSRGGLSEFVGWNHQPPTVTPMMDKENGNEQPQVSTSKASNSKWIQKKSSKVNDQVQFKATKKPKVTKAKAKKNISKSPPLDANDAANVIVRPAMTRKDRMSTRSLLHSHVGACEIEEDTDTIAASPSLAPADVSATELDDSMTGEPASIMVDNNDDDIAQPKKDDCQSRPSISIDVDESSHPFDKATDSIDTSASMGKVVDVPKVIKDQAPSTIAPACTSTKRKKQRTALPSKTTRRRSGRIAKNRQDQIETEESSSKRGDEGSASSKSGTASSTSSEDILQKVSESSAMEVEVTSASTDDQCQTSPVDKVIVNSSNTEEKESLEVQRNDTLAAALERVRLYISQRDSAMEVEVISASAGDNCQTSPVDKVIVNYSNTDEKENLPVQRNDTLAAALERVKLYLSHRDRDRETEKEAKEEEQKSGAARRSRRNVAPPDRFGSYLKDDIADDTPGSNVDSVQNKELTVKVIASAFTASSKSKQRLVHAKPPKARPSSRPSSKRQTSKLPKRGTRDPKVRISEKETDAGTADESATEERFGGMEWTTDEVNALRTAHKTIDPKSVSFWQDVAERLEPRSSSECREKWFSLIHTPVARLKKKQGGIQSGSDIAAHACEEDDIFNSTPMRTLFSATESHTLQASSAGGIGGLSHLSFGSAIKVGNPKAAVGNGGPTTLPFKAGYKTYIKGIRRDANRASKTRIRKKPKAGAPSMPSRKISEKFREGEMAMDGQLSPGGTIKVQKLGGDTSDEDDQFYDEGMEDETHLL